METKGKIIAITEAIKGTSSNGEWAKRTIIVSDGQGEHPNEFVFNLFKKGDYIQYATDKFNYKVGEAVLVTYSVKAKEYQGKWYGDNSIFRIEKLGITEYKADETKDGFPPNEESTTVHVPP